MNRFLVFAWAGWEARGGWHDFQNSFSDVESAISKAKELAKTYDCVHVVDSTTGEYVYQND